MQINTLKIIVVIFLSAFSGGIAAVSQDFSRDLEVADSLFKAAKYTESFDIYQAILDTGEQVSPAMLLKMAYIKEGLNNSSEALFYLNLYYLKSSDELVLNKMEELANQNKILGYGKSDIDVLANLFYKHFNKILIGILTLTGLVFGMMMYFSKTKKEKPYLTAIIVVLLLAVLFYTANYGKLTNQAVIIKSGAFIMSGPSAGSDLLDSPIKGHKVNTISVQDVWTEIEWDNGTGFIKSSYLRKLNY